MCANSQRKHVQTNFQYLVFVQWAHAVFNCPASASVLPEMVGTCHRRLQEGVHVG